MSAERDELHRLVDELPEQEVLAVLTEARRRTHLQSTSDRLPAFFGSFGSGRNNLGADTTTRWPTASAAPE